MAQSQIYGLSVDNYSVSELSEFREKLARSGMPVPRELDDEIVRRLKQELTRPPMTPITPPAQGSIARTTHFEIEVVKNGYVIRSNDETHIASNETELAEIIAASRAKEVMKPKGFPDASAAPRATISASRATISASDAVARALNMS